MFVKEKINEEIEAIWDTDHPQSIDIRYIRTDAEIHIHPPHTNDDDWLMFIAVYRHKGEIDFSYDSRKTKLKTVDYSTGDTKNV